MYVFNQLNYAERKALTQVRGNKKPGKNIPGFLAEREGFEPPDL